MTDDPAARIGALEEILTEKGMIDDESVERIISYFEARVGPMVGARVVARAWVDPPFRERLFANATRAIAELGIGGLQSEQLVALENTPQVHNVVVCTLCSCYPWAVLGLPPAWYKSPEYRSRVVREPRKVLAEMGLTLPRRSRSRSGTRAPISATWSFRRGRPVPRRSTKKRSPDW